MTPCVLHEYAREKGDNALGMAQLLERLHDPENGLNPIARILWIRFRPAKDHPGLISRSPGSLVHGSPDPHDTMPYGALIAHPQPYDRSPRRALKRTAHRFIAWKTGAVYDLREEEPAERHGAYHTASHTGPYYSLREAREALFEACSIRIRPPDCGGWLRIL